MEITYVTTNAGKVASLQRILEPRGIDVTQVSLELPELQTPDLKAIGKHKAEAAYKQVGKPVLVQDAGFFLDAWPGFPGAFVKYALATLDLAGILALVDGRSRRAAFKQCYAYCDGTDTTLFEEEHPGTLLEQERGTLRGDAWGRLWLLFVPDGSTKTLAEMTPAEREKLHQPTAALEFAKWFATKNK